MSRVNELPKKTIYNVKKQISKRSKQDKFSIFFITGVEFYDLTIFFAILLTFCIHGPNSKLNQI